MTAAGHIWVLSYVNDGGEEGIRTLDTLLTYTPLAGERLRPLGHLSAGGYEGETTYFQVKNPRLRCGM